MEFIRSNVREENRAQATVRNITCNKSEVARLVERAVGGDFEAFGQLYSIHLDRIYRYVFYYIKDGMAAEDVTEDVFVKAWKAIKSCKGKEQTFSPWLYRIAHNHVIDSLRARRKYLLTDMDTLGEMRDPQVEVERKLGQQELLATLSYLPPNQKQVIILKFIEGLDNSEIGQVMGKSQGAIRVLQMRALATLRRIVNREK